MPSVFTVSVSRTDWDAGLGGWRCPALAIPGAKVEAVYDKGKKVDDAWYEVLADLRVLRWAREERPERLTISISLTEELSTQAETSRWKKLAVVLPALATVLSALITAEIPKLMSSGRPADMAASAPPARGSNANAVSTGTQIEDVHIQFPRGDKVIIGWKGMPKGLPGDDSLIKAGVDTDEVNAGTRLSYAALAKRDPDTIVYGPLVLGEKLADGFSHAVMRAGPAPDAGYTEFQLFQWDREFIVLLHPMNQNPPPVPPSKTGINWENVKTGLRRALVAMYKDKKAIEFDNVGIYSEPDGMWEYRIRYRVRDR
jgi:hypothetical protein